MGAQPGIMMPGPLNAITDVPGVLVGHVTLIQGNDVRTGVTAIRPHPGNLYQTKVPAGFAMANAHGKMMGTTQIIEFGELETPIVLTNTLSVPRAADGILDWTLSQSGNEHVRSVNPIVGETNDGNMLNNIRKRIVSASDVRKAIDIAKSGPVEEGSVGAGTGTRAFGWKGGIGTSSRKLPDDLGGYTVGVLVQTNYDGILQINGAPVGESLNQYFLKESLGQADADGSIMIIIATDAPLSDRNLRRLAKRSFLGVGRTGSPITNGSGDYAVAFSVAESVLRSQDKTAEGKVAAYAELSNASTSPLFLATVEATEEAIYNSLFMASSMDGYLGSLQALPLEKVREILINHKLLQ